MIQRNIVKLFQAFIEKAEEHKSVLLVEGARQTGKTTAVKMAIQSHSHLYIDLEKEKVFRSQIDECSEFKDWENLLIDTYNFKPGAQKILVIDEAQESSRLGSFVRYMKEEWKYQTTILLGSMMSRLFRDGVREPVGRVHRMVTYPYCFKEFLLAHQKEPLIEAIETWHPSKPLHVHRHTQLIQYLQTYLETGGLPEVVHQHAKGENWRQLLLQLKIQYEEDFVRVYGIEKVTLFQRILKRISETIGGPSKKSAIVNPSQRGYHELDDMLSQCERWHLVHRVVQESYQPTKSGKLLPKRYLFDLGICQLLGSYTRPPINLLSTSSSEVRTPLGGLLENFALCELFHLNPESIGGWRFKVNGSEIDFLMKESGKIFPIEIKASVSFKRNFLFPLKTYLDLYHLNQAYLVDLTLGDIHQLDQKTIYQIPLYALSEIKRII